MVCVLDLSPGGEARAYTCSVRSFCLEDQLPCIQVEVIVVFKDAPGLDPFLLFRSVPGVFVKGVVIAKELFDLNVGGVVEILPPVGLVSIGFHGRGDAALQAWQEIGNGYGRYLCIGFFADPIERFTGPSDMFCSGGMFVAIRAGASTSSLIVEMTSGAILLPLRIVFRYPSSSLLKALVYFRGLRVDFS